MRKYTRVLTVPLNDKRAVTLCVTEDCRNIEYLFTEVEGKTVRRSGFTWRRDTAMAILFLLKEILEPENEVKAEESGDGESAEEPPAEE